MNKIIEIAEFSIENLDLKNFKLDSEFFYQSLPLCVIDSIFSIGVKYESVKNTVQNFCNYTNIHPFRIDRTKIP